MLYKNSRGQIAETATWVVATVVIVLILIFSVYLASLVGKEKSFSYNSEADLFAKKSLTAFLLTTDSSGRIFNQLKSNGELNSFSGNLGLKVFRDLYETEKFYSVVWLGINFEGFSVSGRSNDFFGSYATTSTKRGGDISTGYYSSVSERILLDEEKWIELVLLKG